MDARIKSAHDENGFSNELWERASEPDRAAGEGSSGKRKNL